MTDEKYVSETAGRRYPVLVGIIGILFFFAQWLVPFVAMMVFMPGFVMTSWTIPRVDHGAVHQGAFYYPMKSVGFQDDERRTTSLYRYVPGTESPEKVRDYRADNGYLVSAGDVLWIVSRSSLLRFRQGRLRSISMNATLGTISRPFAYRGRPAVVESRPGGYSLRVFREGQWEQGPSLPIDPRGQRDLDCSALDAVVTDGVLHLFLEFDDGLYHRRVRPRQPDESGAWEPVTGEEKYWNLTVMNGEPAVFYVPPDEAIRSRLVGRRLTNEGWKTFVEVPDATGNVFLVDLGHRSGQFDVLTSGFAKGLTLLRVDQGAIQERVELDEGFMGMFGGMVVGWMMYMVTVVSGSYFVLPVVLVVIVSFMMFRYRVTRFSHEGGSIPYASLLRRAIARGVDLLLLGLPVLAGYFYMMARLFDNPDPRSMVWFFALQVLGMLWVLMVMVMFAFLEGRWGKTPGKWMTGISVVGTDLEFCGFGRAIIRNLLMFVDGFFNFLVGVLMIALTEHWQRLGDYAADTVVVRDPESEGTGPNGEQAHPEP